MKEIDLFAEYQKQEQEIAELGELMIGYSSENENLECRDKEYRRSFEHRLARAIYKAGYRKIEPRGNK